MSRNQDPNLFDVNHNEADIGFDEPFRAVVAFARTGWNGKFGPLPPGLWAGVIDWGTAAIGNHLSNSASKHVL